MGRRVRLRSPLLEATFELERVVDTDMVRAISDVRLPMMTNLSFWLVELALKAANAAAFAGLTDVPFEVEEIKEVESV